MDFVRNHWAPCICYSHMLIMRACNSHWWGVWLAWRAYKCKFEPWAQFYSCWWKFACILFKGNVTIDVFSVRFQNISESKQERSLSNSKFLLLKFKNTYHLLYFKYTRFNNKIMQKYLNIYIGVTIYFPIDQNRFVPHNLYSNRTRCPKSCGMFAIK